MPCHYLQVGTTSFNTQESVGFQGIMLIVIHTIWKNKSCAFYTMQHKHATLNILICHLISFAFFLVFTDKNHWKVMNWDARLKTCIGVSHGLYYIHASSLSKTIHRDIKASNNLLDKEFSPKIVDFALAWPCRKEKSQITTKHRARTMWVNSTLESGDNLSYINVETFKIYVFWFKDVSCHHRILYCPKWN